MFYGTVNTLYDRLLAATFVIIEVSHFCLGYASCQTTGLADFGQPIILEVLVFTIIHECSGIEMFVLELVQVSDSQFFWLLLRGYEIVEVEGRTAFLIGAVDDIHSLLVEPHLF